MLGLIIILALYSLAILLFVPLDKIARAQSSVKAWVKKMLDKAKS